jgi:hypothetical protein
MYRRSAFIITKIIKNIDNSTIDKLLFKKGNFDFLGKDISYIYSFYFFYERDQPIIA